MKRVKIAIALLLAAALCCGLGLRRFQAAAAELKQYARQLESAMAAQDGGELKAMEALEKSWEKNSALLHILSGNESCMPIEESLTRLGAMLRQKEKSSETLPELYSIILAADQLWQTQLPSPINLL